MDSFEYKGYWFLPSNPNSQFGGSLKFDPLNGATLELIGCFRDNNGLVLSEIDFICGVTTDSKLITIYKSYIKKISPITMSGLHSHVGHPINYYYYSDYVFEGRHIKDTDDLKYDTISMSIYKLREWLKLGEEIKFDSKEVLFKPIIPENIYFGITPSVNGSLSFSLIHTPISNKEAIETSIRLMPEVKFKTDKALHFVELLTYCLRFQNFLILSLLDKTYTATITLTSENFAINYGPEYPISRKNVYLYFKTGQNKNNVAENNKSKRLLFSFDLISESFPKIISTWYEKYNVLESVLDLLYEQIYFEKSFPINSFLNLVQAAETLHSRIHDHPKLPAEQYNLMRDKILAACPEEYYGWLKEQLNFGNYLTLQNRLEELIELYSNPTLNNFIGKKDSFIQKVKQSRNYYTHYSIKGEKQAIKGHELFFYIENLKLLLISALLIETGISKEDVASFFQKWESDRQFHKLASTVNWNK